MIEGDKFAFGRKELHFFNQHENFKLGIERYNSHWPDPLPTEQAHYIEATPSYLLYPHVVGRMKKAYGDDAFTRLKFVVILADPTQRHVSWFNHRLIIKDTQAYGTLVHNLNTDVTLYAHEEQMSVETFLVSCGFGQSTPRCYQVNPLLIGAYAAHFHMWLDAGARPDQFEVIFLEEYLADTAGVLRRVTDFLGIRDFAEAEAEDDDDAASDMETKSINRHEHLQVLTPENEALLNEYYAPWNCRLASLLDRKGIRSWEDARTGAGSWFPKHEDCFVPPKPTAFLLGMQKSGSTSLAKSLIDHPDIVWPIKVEYDTYATGYAGPNHVNELHFFDYDDNFEKGTAFYNMHWPDPLPTEQAHYFEATPSYSRLSEAVHNMKTAYGEDAFTKLKFVVILADPTHRHVSWFNHFQVPHGDALASGDAFVPDMNGQIGKFLRERQMTSVDEFVASCGTAECYKRNRLLMGAYAGQLEMWFDAGARPDQFEVVFLDEYVADTAGILRRVTEFLGIRDAVIADAEGQTMETKSINRHEHLQVLTPENEALLNEYYAPWNCRLASLLDRTGIRSWEDAHFSAGSWVPAREECDIE